MSRPVKRSFTIEGHRTSISLETAFWEALKDVAKVKRMPVAQLVQEIDRERGDGGLSSAVRIWLLGHFRSGLAGDVATMEAAAAGPATARAARPAGSDDHGSA